MLPFSTFPQIANVYNAFFYRNVEPNVQLTDGKIKPAVHISE